MSVTLPIPTYNIKFIPQNTKFYLVISSYGENPTNIDIELASHSICQKNHTPNQPTSHNKSNTSINDVGDETMTGKRAKKQGKEVNSNTVATGDSNSVAVVDGEEFLEEK